MIQKDRYDIFRQLGLESRLIKVQIELTHECNLTCVHCKVRHAAETAGGGEITAGDVAALLPELRKTGAVHINLTGGELFTRPDIMEVLEIFFAGDFIYSVQTNATLIGGAALDLMERNRKKIRAVAVSLYAGDARTHDGVTGVEGSFERTVEAVRRMKARGINVAAVTVLMGRNRTCAPQIARLCRELGIQHQFNAIITPGEGGGDAPTRLRLSDEALARLPVPWELIVGMDAHFDAETFGAEQPIISWCTMGRSSCYIESNGEVYPCSLVERSAGNIKRQPFSEIWRDSPVLKEIRDYRVRDFECAGCELLPECCPCPGLAYAEQGDVHAAPREACRLSKIFLKGRVGANV
ncbi:MAG: radical SAM protein [bacterium]